MSDVSIPTVVPIKEAFRKLAIGKTRGFALIKSGELGSFMNGKKRYTTNEMINAFIQKRLEAGKANKPA